MTSNIPFSKVRYYVEANGSKSEVKEVYESFTGWYWFVTDQYADKEDPQIRFGLVVGFETEWGYFSMEEIEPLMIKGQIWRVPKSNWFSISHVQTGE